MNPALAKFIGSTPIVILIIAACAYAGWTARGWRCAAEMSAYQGEQEELEQARFEDAEAERARLEEATEQSSRRLDQQQIEQQKEIVYVEKKVVQYRDRWRDRDCKLNDDWLQLYNASLFGDGPSMPEASKAGSATTGANVLLPAGRN